jgi:hypothetical protein
MRRRSRGESSADQPAEILRRAPRCAGTAGSGNRSSTNGGDHCQDRIVPPRTRTARAGVRTHTGSELNPCGVKSAASQPSSMSSFIPPTPTSNRENREHPQYDEYRDSKKRHYSLPSMAAPIIQTADTRTPKRQPVPKLKLNGFSSSMGGMVRALNPTRKYQCASLP